MGAEMSAIDEIIAERKRQIDIELFDSAHDDRHSGGELASAAACYALGRRTKWWPWDQDWWKPSTRQRNLVKAAALMVAEIERLERLAKAHG